MPISVPGFLIKLIINYWHSNCIGSQVDITYSISHGIVFANAMFMPKNNN